MTRYRRLARYVRPYRRGWAFIVTVTVLSSGLALLEPWPMKLVVDHVLGDAPVPEALGRGVALLPGGGRPGGLLAWAVLASLALFASSAAAGVALTFAWVRVGQRMVYDVARDLFAHLQRQSLLFHSRQPVGDSVSRVMGDSWCVYYVIDALLLKPGLALITSVGMIVVMARLHGRLTLLAVVIAPLIAASSLVFGRVIRAAARARREIESRIQSYVQQVLSGIPVVQAFTQEEKEQRRFQELASVAIRTQQRSTLVDSMAGLSSGLLATLAGAAILWSGARYAMDGTLTVGSLLVFLSYLMALQTQMGLLAATYGGLQKAAANVDRVFEVLEAEPQVRDEPDAVALPRAAGSLRFEHVTFGYERGQAVLHDVCLDIAAGETVAFVGPTGAGKSTLVSLVPRFADPWEGRVTLDGHDLRHLRLNSVRSHVALVLQEPFLFPLTVADNIAYGRPDASRDEIEAAARAANAHAFIERLPQGYDTPLGERGATLSGGERQRLSIARALLKDAAVLILDEPSSALDTRTEQLVLEALERLMEDRTTLIIAHRLSTVRRADRIVTVEKGRLTEIGTHRELLARHGLYARFHERQAAPRPPTG